MKKTFIDIRDKRLSGQIVYTYSFTGDISIIVTNLNTVRVIQHSNNPLTVDIPLEKDQAFSVRNWGNII